MKIAFVTDSACGVSPTEMKKKGIYCIPLQIVFVDQEKTLLDFVDTTNEEIYSFIKEGQRMTTSVPPLGVIEDIFNEIKKDGYEAIFCIPINAGLSSAYNAFRVAAQEVGIIFVHMDIHTTSECQRYCIEMAKKMYDEGKSIEEISNAVQVVGDSSFTYVLPNDLDHLKRGGRLTPMAATLAGLLKIKPILKIDKSCDGKIDVFDKIRTYTKALDRIVKALLENRVDDSYVIRIASTDDHEHALMMKDKLLEHFPNHDIQIVDLVSVIAVHTGCDCIGVQAFKKEG